MAVRRYTLREIHQDLCSRNAETRGQAMNRLVLWLKKDPSIGQSVLPMLRAAIDGETDAWTASRAIEGLESIVGFQDARESWETLLARPDAVFVSRIALSANQPHHFSMLRESLAERREIPIRSVYVRMLGRSTMREAFERIAIELNEPLLRTDAINALGELGDPRGLPLLEPFLNDNTPVGRQDERGAMLYVSDLANDSIRMIKRKMATPSEFPREH